jgi:hypothetical protein
MIQKMKRTIQLGKKVCVACEKEFQPASGAQMTCSAECKEEAKNKGLTKRRIGGEVDPVVVDSDLPRSHSRGEKTFFNGQPIGPEANLSVLKVPATSALPAVAPRRPGSPIGGTRVAKTPENALPDLELDLSPIEVYIRALVTQEVKSAIGKLGIQGVDQSGELREEVNLLVNEAIAKRLKGLLST